MEKGKKKKVIVSVLAIAIVAGAITGGFAIKKNIAGKKAKANAVTEVTTKKDRVNQILTFDGTIAYDDEVKYYAETTDDYKQISKVLVEKGDFVKEGQTLVEYSMDKYNDLKDSLVKAKLDLAALEEDLKNYTAKDNVEILTLSNSIDANDSQAKEYQSAIRDNENIINQKKSKLALLEKTLKQDKELYNKGYKSESDIKDSENTVQTYKDDISKLTATNDTLKRNINSQNSSKKINSEKLRIEQNRALDKTISYEIKVKKIAIEKEKIEIATIEKNIARFQRDTKATKDGVVTAVNVTDNQTVNVGTELVTTADSKKLIINADVSEYEVNKIAIGDKATVTGDGFDKEYTATVTKILPVAGKDSDDNVIVPIELTLEPVKETIRNNYTVSVTIVKRPKNKSNLVAISAIVKDSSGKSYVNVEDPKTKKVSKKQITTGEIKGTEVEVFGLNAKDKVVITQEDKTKKTANTMGPQGGGPPHGGVEFD